MQPQPAPNVPTTPALSPRADVPEAVRCPEPVTREITPTAPSRNLGTYMRLSGIPQSNL